MPVVATFSVTGILISSLPQTDGNDVQDGTTRDRYQDSLIADETRKWIKCNLTHDDDNLDAAGCRDSEQFTPVDEQIREGRTTICEDTKLARFGDGRKFR